MKVSHFAKILAGNNAVKISENLIVFNDFELYDMAADESKNYDSLEALLADNEDVKKIIDDAPYFELEWRGGRGASGASDKEMGGGFTNSRGGGKDRSETIRNAELNFDTAKGNSLTAVYNRFRQKYGTADHEYGAAIDDQGFVHYLRNGNKSNVTYEPAYLDKMTILHNHPNGGNFSKADLISTATTNAKGVIATSSDAKIKKTYHFQKNQNFKAKEFVKAVNKAKWPKKYDYDKGADWWLRRNQRTYGYKYKSTSSGKLIGE